MSTNWRTVYTLCPFYKKETGDRIVCEGVPDQTVTSLNFTSANAKNEFKTIYCEANYKACPYARILYDKWDSK